MVDQWYYADQGQRNGPVTEEQIKKLAVTGQIKPSDMVWKQGMTQWIQASQIAGLLPPLPPSLPPRESDSSGLPPLSGSSEWHYLQDEQRKGPTSEQKLRELVLCGQIRPTDLVWKKGMSQWVPLRQIIPLPANVPNVVPSDSTGLEKCYLPFQITLIVIFTLGVATLGISYWHGLFAVAIGFSICNFIAGKDNKLGTAPWDIIIMVLALISLIPLIGWITQILALVFSTVALLNYLRGRPSAYKLS